MLLQQAPVRSKVLEKPYNHKSLTVHNTVLVHCGIRFTELATTQAVKQGKILQVEEKYCTVQSTTKKKFFFFFLINETAIRIVEI